MLNSIDLFSGAGGLSEGMKQAGFNVLAAVENNFDAAKTFKVNNPDAHIFESDIRLVSPTEIKNKTGLSRGELDILSGCPPCQGFSTLTSKYDENDQRNSLINEVSRLVRELLPRAVMIENVPGLMTRGSNFLESFIEELKELGYRCSYDVLQVADYGVPQERRRFVLLAGLGFDIKIPSPTHSRNGDFGLPKWKTVKDALSDMPPPILHKDSLLCGGPQKFNWHVIRQLAPINLKRLLYLKEGGNRYDIPDHLRPKCHQGKNSGFGNVYGRMSWNKPSPTITGGCTVLSKGRFGHPSENRTMSVREAARLQTFPDSFIFNTESIDKACQMIGNALPCEFARIMSEACKEAIIIHKTKVAA